MSTNRRSLIFDKLQIKPSGGSKKKQMVVAQSGIPNPGDMSFHAIPAQIKVFKESYNPSPRNTKANIQNPRLTISLEAARISIVNPSPTKESPRKLTKTSAYSFTVTTREGSCYEFVTDKESDRLVWVTVLEFLSMFPYSSVPEVPRCNPLFQRELDPGVYNADSAWPVYILPEEVGSRCSIIGSNILTLQKRVEGTRLGKLEIYNPTDCSEPSISWDHDKIRRTGKLGRLLFIEIGRRCRGGPGLVWMYTGANEKVAFELRDTLRRFLFDQESSTASVATGLLPVDRPTEQTRSEDSSSDSEQMVPPPLPPLRRSISSPGTERITTCDNPLKHNYHILEPTPCASC